MFDTDIENYFTPNQLIRNLNWLNGRSCNNQKLILSEPFIYNFADRADRSQSWRLLVLLGVVKIWDIRIWDPVQKTTNEIEQLFIYQILTILTNSNGISFKSTNTAFHKETALSALVFNSVLHTYLLTKNWDAFDIPSKYLT